MMSKFVASNSGGMELPSVEMEKTMGGAGEDPGAEGRWTLMYEPGIQGSSLGRR